jgi:sigma-B regulation protein RsbU (phosphoserine phosphatase)
MPKSKSLQQKAFRMILTAAAALLFVVGGINFVITTITTMQGYKRETAHDMRYAVSLIDAEYIENLYHKLWERYNTIPEEIRNNPYTEEYVEYVMEFVDDDFWKARDILEKCRIETELENVCLLLPDTTRKRLIYVIDGYEVKHAYFPGQWISEEYSATDSPEEIQRILDSSFLMYPDYGDVSGWISTNYIEINDREGNFLGYASCDIDITSFIYRMIIQVVVYLDLLILAVVFMAWGMSRNIDRWMITPVNKLARAAKEYKGRDKTKLDDDIDESCPKEYFESLDILRSGDEIEILWDSLSDMEKDINLTMKRIRQMTAEKERLSAELEVATKIQANMLPKSFPLFPENDEFTLCASMDPAKEVGGDFYDVFKMDDDHLCMVIGDVSGKGVPAALFMVRSMSVIRDRAKAGRTPAEILEESNNVLYEGNSETMFVTVWMGILCLSTGELIESNAGHEDPAFKKKDGEFELIKKSHGFMLGAFSNRKYKNDTILMEKGDCIFVYTDGLIDATNKDDERFKTERMIQALNSYKDDAPDELLGHIKSEIDGFVQDAEQFDDLTMLAFFYNGTGGETSL